MSQDVLQVGSFLRTVDGQGGCGFRCLCMDAASQLSPDYNSLFNASNLEVDH